MVDVTLVGAISEIAGTRSLEAEASTVGELIDVLSGRFGRDFKKAVRGARIVVNGSPSQYLAGNKTPLGAGDEVAFLVPAGGG